LRAALAPLVVLPLRDGDAPRLGCSTHAFGAMPLNIKLVGPDGTVLDEVRR
jgi:hypothetical protein